MQNIDLLISPQRLAQVKKEEEILNALQNLHLAALTGNESTIRKARYESRGVLVKYRKATYYAALDEYISQTE